MTHDAPDLARQGGKGANLVRLAAAGLPVPRFVVLETTEYERFVTASGLDGAIRRALAQGDRATASEQIRAAFGAARLPVALRATIADAVAPLADGPVAVRSSATAEDLPGFSFAGQQDTFLNVVGIEAILTAVVQCWASLWTERALTYRDRNAIGHEGVALAVVVQEMVAAEASGVMFTANPRTGRRDETVIESVAGLGDALVSGQVTPDTFSLAGATAELRGRHLACRTASLSIGDARRLTELGQVIERLYAEPMDIEWARTGEELSILQARPITSLYPLPAPAPGASEMRVWFSFGAVQGMLEPITPLGQDVLRVLLSGAGRLVGRRVDWRTNAFVQTAGERLWLRVDAALRAGMTRKLLFQAMPVADPAIAGILADLAKEPELKIVRATPSTRTMTAITRLVTTTTPRARAALRDPVRARQHAERVAERLVESFRRIVAATGRAATPQARLTERVKAVETMGARFFPTLLPALAPLWGGVLIALRRLREEAARSGLPDADALVLSMLRALPGNVTAEMDLTLADVAETIRHDATAWGWLAETPASDLAAQHLRGNLPRVAQDAIGQFLADYGMRGIAEIDLGAPRWRDDPTPVMATLKGYLATRRAVTPREAHRLAQQDAGRTVRSLMDAAPKRADRIRDAAKAVRGMFGIWETPKFTIVRAFGLLRDAFDASGAELVEAGRLAAASDIYLLHLDELRRAFSSDWHQVVADRKATLVAEGRRTQVPRVLISDGRAFFEGLDAGDDGLGGMGVSPGVAEGVVRVVHDPRREHLERGEILVCRGTDPAWTPLFLTAAGLITEVGGLMTHGSVVAREYGIPAVVGVHDATTRLTTGQRIRIDGSSGAIELL